jgi:signal transduction histidine kinase
MQENELLICNKAASPQNIRAAEVLAILLLLALVPFFPFRFHQLPQVVPFIAVIDTMHFVFNGVIATVLLCLALILRSRALIALGTGYFFTALIAVAHGLTYPKTFTDTGLLGANYDTVRWLYLVWHAALPLCIIAYALLRQSALPWIDRTPGRTILCSLAVAALVAAAAVWLATQGGTRLPGLVAGELRLTEWKTNSLQYLVMLLCAATMLMLWRRQRSLLDICLMLTLWAWILEAALVAPNVPRFSVGWYAGRTMGLVSATSVLMIVMVETIRLYGRAVALTAAQARQRENRLMLGEAIGAYIAHELRQPLSAIALNAHTARALDKRHDAQLAEVLTELEADSRRAAEIMDNMRASFGKGPSRRELTDINQLVRETAHIMAPELRRRGVSLDLRLIEPLPPVAANRLQIQQVLMNLFINAAEAMAQSENRPRILTVRSSFGDTGLLIGVEDTGPGIAKAECERIFDPFFTTKAQGTGVGLSICRSVIIAHGGSIQASPRAPAGSTFEIRLPAAAQMAGA